MSIVKRNKEKEEKEKEEEEEEEDEDGKDEKVASLYNKDLGVHVNSKQQHGETVVEGSGKLDFGQYELELWDLRYNRNQHTSTTQTMQERGVEGGRGDDARRRGERRGSSTGRENSSNNNNNKSLMMKLVRPSCLPVTIVVTLSLLIVVMALLDGTLLRTGDADVCCDCDDCSFQLVESIPENLTYSPGSVHYPSTYQAWTSLIQRAESSIDIAAFYWTLLNEDVTPKPIPSAWQGRDILTRLNDTGLKGDVKIRIAQNWPSKSSPQRESAMLADAGAAQVRSLDFRHLVGGVLHTKLWVVDGKHLYLGSANMDWRALTQVKEVGIVISNCSCLVKDISKIFEVYWQLGKEGAVIPASWPSDLETSFNIENQMNILLSGAYVNTYLSSSPPPLSPKGRSDDIIAILDVIDKAQHFVYVAVMDYFPRMLYSKDRKFWPVIDERLRAAAWERGVRVRVLGSHWSHTRPDMPAFLASLQALTGNHTNMDVQARLFVVPSYTDQQRKIPFARVNHNKYMVTDNTAYIGTSNWSGDYFINTAGVGLVVNETVTSSTPQPNSTQPHSTTLSLRAQLQALFERDWDSEFAKPVKEFL
ncbi:hypothetical protein Pcinc_003912 [Petrolisthes cinctipes]|uniref:PLD phosphodiesterase domain-containing protein n=1 Tax=Petrolisthes cinctipes TaxID=88211 RepID=A0AAE1GIA4_PETCI|nr:hypothetical protein Pcinc_003912 [Petrolisthes cinctipes]